MILNQWGCEKVASQVCVCVFFLSRGSGEYVIVSTAETLRMTDAQANFDIFFKSETPLSLILDGIRTHNFLTFGQTTKPPD